MFVPQFHLPVPPVGGQIGVFDDCSLAAPAMAVQAQTMSDDDLDALLHEEAPPAPGLLERAILLMDARCDGASTKDGSGWNKVDTAWMAPNVATARTGGRLPNEVRAAILKRLQKYGGQLFEAGLNLNDILMEEAAAAKAAKAASDESEQKRTVADKVIDIGLGDELFRDERGDAYARVCTTQGFQVSRIDGTPYKNTLRHRYYLENEKGVSGEALLTAVSTLAAHACHGDVVHLLHNRFAHVLDDKRRHGIWLDLADDHGRAVLVTADGWTVVDEPPVLFRRYPHQEALPVPETGGTMADLKRHLRLRRPEDALLLDCWLPCAAVADIPRPIVMLHGAQGTGKTTCARMLRRLLDPSRVAAMRLPSKVDEIALQADQHALPAWDNLTRIDGAQGDTLCTVVTGGGISKRTLYTNADSTILTFLRAPILTGICVPTAAPDLLDRCLLLELERIPEAERVEEADLWREFEAERSRLLGAILDVLAGAIAVHPTLQLQNLPRMADWARWAAAAAVAMGRRPEDVLDAYAGNRVRQHQEVVEADPVAAAVSALVAEVGTWSGTPNELLALLSSRREEEGHRGDGWPAAPNKLTRRLRILESTFREVGVEFSTRAAHHGRVVTLRANPPEGGMESSRPSLSSQPAHRQGCLRNDTAAPTVADLHSLVAPALDRDGTMTDRDDTAEVVVSRNTARMQGRSGRDDCDDNRRGPGGSANASNAEDDREEVFL